MDQTNRPEAIMRLRDAVNPPFALLAGIQLGVFTTLNQGAATAQEAADKLGVHAGKLEVLLYALVPTGLILVEDGRFFNSPEAEQFLVEGRPGYLGEGYVSTAEGRWRALLKTADSVRTGTAQAKLDYTNASEEQLNIHYKSFFAQTQSKGRNLAELFDFTKHRRLLDVAGGTGGLAAALTTACPELHATVIDLPEVTPTTQRYVDEAGAGDRVTVLAGNVVSGPIVGTYDVAVVSNFLPVLSREDARQVLVNLGRVIEPGGVIYLADQGTIDDTRFSPAGIAQSSLFFINAFDNGCPKTESERRAWLEEAGFQEIKRLPFPEGGSIMVAEMPG